MMRKPRRKIDATLKAKIALRVGEQTARPGAEIAEAARNAALGMKPPARWI